jgi:hypothetical protein
MIQQKISEEERMYQEYLTDTYNKAKVDALYAVTRLKEDVPREGIRDEL